MKIAVIGAGFTGLAASLALLEAGHEVVLLEADDKPGGLAVGFKGKDWQWSLEKFYHHIFTNDDAIIALSSKVDCPPVFKTPKTCIFRRGEISQLDSPASLLANRELTVKGRLRLAAGLAILKCLPMNMATHLEALTTTSTLPWLVGREGYQKVWEPLLAAKFGPFKDEVNLAWFWARVAKRTTALGYFDGGFQALAEACVDHIRLLGGEVKFGYKVKRVDTSDEGVTVDGIKADKVLLTVPAPLVDKLVGPLVTWPKINYLWGQTLVLELQDRFMDPYWLNILEPDWPFLVAVEHTNFVDAKHYGGRHLLYLGNYLPDGDKRLKLADHKLLELYLPYLQQISPKFDPKQIVNAYRFQAPFAQPVFPKNYSRRLPGLTTSNPRIFVANMSLVYPWDRGTNYAVGLGQNAAKEITS